jgi:TolB-like protein
MPYSVSRGFSRQVAQTQSVGQDRWALNIEYLVFGIVLSSGRRFMVSLRVVNIVEDR